jgi:hypothetical protein
MLRTFIAALALAATLAVGSQPAAVNVPPALDGLHTSGTGDRAYPGGQKTN